MLLNKSHSFIILLGVAIVLLVFVGYGISTSDNIRKEVYECSLELSETKQIDCWHQIVRDMFDTGGTQSAFEVFEYIYWKYDTFANTGCHRHAHRVGDMAYYFDYLAHREFDEVAFPRNASACGYGFYHGFFEHLVQDNPTVEAVTEMCAYMKNRLEEIAPAISQTCYHGAGHGFLLSVLDKNSNPEDWSIDIFTRGPLELCESLPQATEFEIAECRQGVFNVLVDWKDDEEFGLSYNREAPFAFCDAQELHRRGDCYYEVAQKLDRVSGFSPERAAEITLEIQDPAHHSKVLGTAVAGMVQHNPNDSQLELLTSCRNIESEDLREVCIRAIVGGIFEHSTSNDNYTHAVRFCTSSGLSSDEQSTCFESALSGMHRFNSEERIKHLCKKRTFPEAFCKHVFDA